MLYYVKSNLSPLLVTNDPFAQHDYQEHREELDVMVCVLE